MLEAFADGFVQSQNIGRLQTLAIRRVRHNDCLILRLGKLTEVLLAELYHIAHTSLFGIGHSSFESRTIDVVGVNLMVEFTFSRVVVIYTIEQIAVKVFPFLEAETLTEDTRIDIARHESGFDSYSARTAERVDQVAFHIPSTQLNETGCQHFVDRSITRSHTIATQVKTLATRIERERTLVFSDVHIQLDVGICHTNIRTFALFLAKIVHNGVLHLISNKLGVAELLRIDHRIDGKSSVQIEIVSPFDGLYCLVDSFCIESLEMLDRFEHSDSCAKAEVCSIEHFLVSRKRHHTTTNLYVVSTEFGEFLSQYFFQSLKGFGNEFEFFHKVSLAVGG